MLDTVLLFLMLVKMAAIIIANLPDADYLEGCNFDPLPYFLIRDEILPSEHG